MAPPAPSFFPSYSPSYSPLCRCGLLRFPLLPLLAAPFSLPPTTRFPEALHSSDGAIYDVVIEAFFKQGKNAKVTADRIMEAYEELSSGMPLAGGR